MGILNSVQLNPRISYFKNSTNTLAHFLNQRVVKVALPILGFMSVSYISYVIFFQRRDRFSIFKSETSGTQTKPIFHLSHPLEIDLRENRGYYLENLKNMLRAIFAVYKNEDDAYVTIYIGNADKQITIFNSEQDGSLPEWDYIDKRIEVTVNYRVEEGLNVAIPENCNINRSELIEIAMQEISNLYTSVGIDQENNEHRPIDDLANRGLDLLHLDSNDDSLDQ